MGDLNSQNKIMLIGDSQKETLELSINNFAIDNKIKVYNINHCENFDDILTNPFCKNAIQIAKQNQINKIIINFFWRDKIEKIFMEKNIEEQNQKKLNFVNYLKNLIMIK